MGAVLARPLVDLVAGYPRFVSRRVEMNYHARLVEYLREKSIITTEEADAQLHPAIAGGVQVTMGMVYELDGGDKPVCVAEIVFRYYA